MSNALEPKVFCPKNGETYYFIVPSSDSLFSSKPFDSSDVHDRDNFFLGHCFGSEEEVIAAIEWLQVRALLRFYATREPWDPKTAFRICWHENVGINRAPDFYLDFSEYESSDGIYFPSRKAFEYALERIGKERVKKYLRLNL